MEQVDAATWDRLVAHSSFFMNRVYLQALEQAGPTALRHRYAVVERDGVPVAAVTAQIFDVTGERLAEAQEQMPGLGASVRNAALRVMGGSVVLCGNLFSTGPHGVAVAAGLEPARVWPAAIEALERIREAEPEENRPAYIFFKDVPSGDPTCPETVLRDAGFRRVKTGPDMVLDIPSEWKSHEDYFAALRAKYRKAARNVFEAIEESGCVVEVVGDLEAEAEALHALYAQVAGHAQAHILSFPPTYLPALAKAAGDRFRCTAIRRDGALIGFMTVLKDGDTLAAGYCGFDYAANVRFPIYFRLLHTIVADAFEFGCRSISFGRTTVEPKRRLGAKPAPLAGWIRHNNPVVNFAIRPLARMISQEAAPKRRPFKQEM